MKRIVTSLAAIIFILGACTRVEIAETFSGSFEFSLEGTLAQMDGEETLTKGQTYPVIRLFWEAGDEISVINLTTGKILGGTLQAQGSGKTTKFAGTLTGGISVEDNLAFLYPAVGNATEQTFVSASVDFSNQEGKSSIPFCAYAISSLSGTEVASASANFKFLSTFFQLNVASLPESSQIEYLEVSDMGAALTITADGTDLECVSTIGAIRVSPDNVSTTEDGVMTFFLASGTSEGLTEDRTITAYVSDMIYTSVWGKNDIEANKYYNTVVSDWTPEYYDGKILFAEHASYGRGIDIVFVGDGYVYSRNQEDMRTYEEDMEWMRDALFTMEPFKSHRGYFNLYSGYALSNEHKNYSPTGLNGANDYDADTRFKTELTPNSTHINGDNGTVRAFARKLITDIEGVEPSADRMNDVLIVVMVNADVNAGTCHMSRKLSEDRDYGCGFSVGYFSKNSNTETMRKTMLHEAVGHGFAKLADEYSSKGPYSYSGPTNQENGYVLKNTFHPIGWYRNVEPMQTPASLTDPTWVANDDIGWQAFIDDTNSSYYNSVLSAEYISKYEGAYTYSTSFWRPTNNSIMNYHYVETKFNAPSRRLIWYRIHKLADPSFTDDYAAFCAWDIAHQDEGIRLLIPYYVPSSSAGSALAGMQYRHEPPVVHVGYWTEDDKWIETGIESL